MGKQRPSPKANRPSPPAPAAASSAEPPETTTAASSAEAPDTMAAAAPSRLKPSAAAAPVPVPTLRPGRTAPASSADPTAPSEAAAPAASPVGALNLGPMPSPVGGIRPGLILTLGEVPEILESLPKGLPIVRHVQPQTVMLHTYPKATTPRVAKAVRAAAPGASIAVQIPSNILVGMTPEKAAAKVRDWVQICVEIGADFVSFNAEGSSDPRGKYGAPRPGWKAGQPLSRSDLAQHARVVVAAAQEAAEGHPLALAFSTHDWLLTHGAEGLPVRELAQLEYLLPQVYPAPPKGIASHRSAMARWRATLAQLERADALDWIRPDQLDNGDRGSLVLYTQAHGLTLSAAMGLHNLATRSAAWTAPEAIDRVGMAALAFDSELRARFGDEPGRIERFQEHAGLADVDGIVGPQTLDALLQHLGPRGAEIAKADPKTLPLI